MCFYLSPICTISCSDNVFDKIHIISAAADLGGININDEYFHVRGRVIFGDVLLFIPNLAQFSFVRKKNWKTNRQTVQIKLLYKKIEKRKKKKKKGKREKREKGKGRENGKGKSEKGKGKNEKREKRKREQ